MLLKKLQDAEKDVGSVAFSMISSFLAGVAFVAGGDAIKWGLIYWIAFITVGSIFFVLSIRFALRPIKRASIKQKELEKQIIYSEIENLRLHLAELKLSLDTNKFKIEKNVLLENQYWGIISKIESAKQEIESELNKDEVKSE